MRDANRQEDIHHWDDGRGPRILYVDGKMVSSALFADVRRGLVVAARTPVRLDKYRKRILKRRIRGRVEVFFPPK